MSEGALSKFQCQLSPLPNLDELASQWQALEKESSASFFCCWSWVGSWLQQLPEPFSVQLLTITDNDQVVALACIAVKHNHYYLNQTGSAELDALFIEHNMLLVRREVELSAVQAALSFFLLERPEGGKLILSGIDRTAIPAGLLDDKFHVES